MNFTSGCRMTSACLALTCKVLVFWNTCILSLEAAVPVAAYFNGAFPDKVPDGTYWSSENAFPNLTFTDPMWLMPVPNSQNLILLEKRGRIRIFPNNPAATRSQVADVINLSSVLQESEDQGLYRLAFHPEFGRAGSMNADKVFITYSHRPASSSATPDRSMWRLSRFTWNFSTNKIDPQSESVLIQQYDPDRWHNAGGLEFDNDGYLLVLCGDGGSARDLLRLSQKINEGFFGGVLRIDVDNDPARSNPIARQPISPQGIPADFPQSFSQGYGIPKDNPWVSSPGTTLGEFYAIGLRSPHGAHYDRVLGELWVGDVGQESYEELNRIKKAGNYQWPVREGYNAAGSYGFTGAITIGDETTPELAYGRSVGSCIIGGMRYRGAKWTAQLGGKVLFADNIRGYVKTFDPELPQDSTNPSLVIQTSGSLYSGIANLCTDQTGEVYFLQLNGNGQDGGTIRKLVTLDTREPPFLLSQTGLFTDTASLTPAPALIAYDVASPLWSDGAEKQRWMAIPHSGTYSVGITYSATGNWGFPAGTVFVKHFEMAVDERQPGTTKRLETRVIVCTTDGKYGVTYRWNADGTDAVLLTTGEEEQFTVTKTDGSVENRRWTYPSRADCMQCHTTVAGKALGLRTHQSNFEFYRADTDSVVNQLKHFSDLSLFNTNISIPALNARPLDDESAPLEHRIRSYLDSNCSHCHQPGSAVPYFDARLQTPLKNQGLINAMIRGRYHMPGGSYLKPGSPSLSAIHERLASTAPGVAMPSIGKHVVDQRAVELLESYLQGLADEEFSTQPIRARYMRFTVSQSSGDVVAVADFFPLDDQGNRIMAPEAGVFAFSNESFPGMAPNAIDGDALTLWTSPASWTNPAFITMDLGSERPIGGFEYIPRQDSATGRVNSYQVHYSSDGSSWTLMNSKTIASPHPATSEIYDSLANIRPTRVSIGAPAETLAKFFPVTIVFDSAVTDFTAADISTSGGEVTELRGSGYYYVAIVRADQPLVSVSVSPNVAGGTLGNFASNTSITSSNLETPPIPVWTGASNRHLGAFEITLSFDKTQSGFTREDIILSGATMEWFVPDGESWKILLAPTGTGAVSVKLREKAVKGASGLTSDEALLVSSTFLAPMTGIEAESLFGSGFSTYPDPNASGGYFRFVPAGNRQGVTTPSASYRISASTLKPPIPGNYRLRALTRASSLERDSFYVRVGTATAEPLPWRTNRGAGEVGSGRFHAGFAADDSGVAYVFPLSATETSIDLFAAEDGTQIDRLDLIPERPVAWWTFQAPSTSHPTRTIQLSFTSPVTGLGPEDFETRDGVVTSVSGSGQTYSVAIRPDSAKMLVRLKDNSVTDEFGAAGVASGWFFSRLVGGYDQWTLDRGTSGTESRDLLDPDSDGLGQLMEYALGLDPSTPDARPIDPADPSSRGLPHLSIAEDDHGRRMSVTFHRRRGTVPFHYIVEFTDDFDNYHRQTDFTGRTETIDEFWERVVVPDLSASGTEPARFGRLIIERKR